ELLEYELPVVLYDRINFDLPVDKIGVDDKGSILDAVQHLFKKGNRKIGLVSAIHNIDVGRLRIEGYREAITELGLQAYVTTDEEVTGLRDKIASLYEAGVQGVICTDIVSTLLASRVAFENNIKIPGDLKIIGYVNEDLAPFLAPSLSYINQHPRRIGETAINFLYDRINPKERNVAPKKEILKTDMVHLDSTRFS